MIGSLSVGTKSNDLIVMTVVCEVLKGNDR